MGSAKSYVGSNSISSSITACTIPQSYQWIERLLETAISDHRKYTLELVLAPYLVVIKHLSFDEAYSMIKNWALKCHALKILDTSFDIRIKSAIKKSVQNGIPPIRKETIKKNYSNWYKDFKQLQLLD